MCEKFLQYINFLILESRSPPRRNSDRSNDDQLHCNGLKGYPEQAVNSIVAGHLLRKVVKKVFKKLSYLKS